MKSVVYILDARFGVPLLATNYGAPPCTSGWFRLTGASRSAFRGTASITEFEWIPSFHGKWILSKGYTMREVGSRQPRRHCRIRTTLFIVVGFYKDTSHEMETLRLQHNCCYCSAVCTFKYPLRGKSIIRCRLDFASWVQVTWPSDRPNINI